MLYGRVLPALGCPAPEPFERQEKNPQASMTQEEFDKKKEEQAEKRKARIERGTLHRPEETEILHLYDRESED